MTVVNNTYPTVPTNHSYIVIIFNSIPIFTVEAAMASSGTDAADMSPLPGQGRQHTVRSRASSLYIGHVQTHRPVYSQQKFDAGHGLVGAQELTVTEYLQRQLYGCTCSLKCVRETIVGFLPFLAILSNYNLRHDLVKDIIAGLTVGVMHIPQGGLGACDVLCKNVQCLVRWILSVLFY